MHGLDLKPGSRSLKKKLHTTNLVNRGALLVGLALSIGSYPVATHTPTIASIRQALSLPRRIGICALMHLGNAVGLARTSAGWAPASGHISSVAVSRTWRLAPHLKNCAERAILSCGAVGP